MSISLQADPTLPQGYLKINGTTAATVSTSGVMPAWSAKTANYTAANGDFVLADTSSSAWTLTLPASPVAGNQVAVADAGAKWATNNLTVARNGSTIEGLSEDLVCDRSSRRITLYYNGTTWRVIG